MNDTTNPLGMTHEQVQRFDAALKRDRDRHAKLAADPQQKAAARHIHEDKKEALEYARHLLNLHSGGRYGELYSNTPSRTETTEC